MLLGTIWTDGGGTIWIDGGGTIWIDAAGTGSLIYPETEVFTLRNDPDLLTTIENEDDLIAYLDTLRQELSHKLKNNKIIILK